jgi:hypothetical protein
MRAVCGRRLPSNRLWSRRPRNGFPIRVPKWPSCALRTWR